MLMTEAQGIEHFNNDMMGQSRQWCNVTVVLGPFHINKDEWYCHQHHTGSVYTNYGRLTVSNAFVMSLASKQQNTMIF